MAKKLKELSLSTPASAKPKSKPKRLETVSSVEPKSLKRRLKQDTETTVEEDREMSKKTKTATRTEGIGKVESGKDKTGRPGSKSGEMTSKRAPPLKADSINKKRKPAAAGARPTEIIDVEVGDGDYDDEWTGFGDTKGSDPEPQRKKENKTEVEKKPGAVQSRKPTPKKQIPEQPEPEVEEDDVGSEGDHDSVYLHGFSSDDQDSSDEDDMVDDAPAFDVHKLPTVAKDDKSVKRKLDQAKRLPTEDRGVIYLGRIPHGFYEDQMKLYFTQFGEVTRVRLSRNRKTGRSKHYGFIEFDSSRVAEIVAETMDNYLLMGHILRCRLVPKAEVHPELWIGANRKFKVLPRARLECDSHNKLRTEDEQSKAVGRLIRRQQLKKRKLAEMGIEYNFDAAAYKKKPKI